MKSERGQVGLFTCGFLLLGVVIIAGILLVGQPGNICFPIPCPDTNTSGPDTIRADEGVGMVLALPFAIFGGMVFMYLWFKLRRSRWD